MAADLGLHVANAACPGETSASLIDATAPSNGCEATGSTPGYRTLYPLHVSYSGSQLDYAVHYLRTHRQTRLVSLMIGANDAFLCEKFPPARVVHSAGRIRATGRPALSTARRGQLAAIGVEVVVTIGKRPIPIDAEREQLRDVLGRHFPPHWELEPVVWLDRWWGWWRKHPNVRLFPPQYRYWKRQPPGGGELGWLNEDYLLARRWEDST